MKTRKATTEKKYKCPYCKMPSFCDPDSVNKHLINYHMEHFFQSERIEASVSEKQFKAILGDLLFPHFFQEGDSKCRICEKKFMNSKVTQRSSAFKYHLVREHHEALKDKLESIQHNPNLPEMLSICSPNAVICSCGAYLRSERSRIFHQKYSGCKTTININTPSTDHPDQLNCDKCGKKECVHCFRNLDPSTVLSNEDKEVEKIDEMSTFKTNNVSYINTDAYTSDLDPLA